VSCQTSAVENIPLRASDLTIPFRESERSPDSFLIGAESEKFGVHQTTGRPLDYGGDYSVCRVLSYLADNHGWSPIRENPDAPVIGLSRGGASITLEPSAQLELSGAPLSDLHQVDAEAKSHLDEIRPISEELNLVWLGTGFHPLAKLSELTWVPKQRYPIMREYLPKMGSGGLDMMQRTATVQGNFDWQNEADAMLKMRVALKLSPLLQAWFANAPFSEGKKADSLSMRGNVWRHMDPSRSGLIAAFWDGEVSYETYVEWALDAGMFLFRRDGKTVQNTGQTFRAFMKDGFEGHQATLADFRLHLTTLFPEVRLKNTLEVRSADHVPPPLASAALAVWTGLLYDHAALNQAAELTADWQFANIEAERPELIRRGLHAPLAGADGFSWAEKICEIARGGLSRRGRKNDRAEDETIFLRPAQEILETRVLPAEAALLRYEQSGSLIEATRIRY
jgi:glutamate--cysteine ligase